MRRVRRIFSVLLIFTGLCLCLVSLWQCSPHKRSGKEKKNVIVFYSFNEDNSKKVIDHLAVSLLSNPFDIETSSYFIDTYSKNYSTVEREIEKAFSETERPDLVMVYGDIALNAILKSRNPVLKKIQIVFAGVHFPEMDEILRHPNVSGYLDSPDIWRNMLLAQELCGNPAIEMNYSLTELGFIRHEYIKKALKGMPVSIYYDWNNALRDSTIEQHRNSICINPRALQIHFVPLSRMTSKELVDHFDTRNYRNKKVFLVSKYEPTSRTICNLYNIPIFTCINDGMDPDINSVGGYFAPLSTVVSDWLSMTIDVLDKGKVIKQSIKESKKSYVFDYKILKNWDIDVDNLPRGSKLLQEPLTLRFSSMLVLLAIMAIIIVAIIVYTYIVIRRNTDQQNKMSHQLRQNISELITSISSTNVILFTLDENHNLRLSDRDDMASDPDGDPDSLYNPDSPGHRRTHLSIEEIQQYLRPGSYKTLREEIDNIYEGKTGSFVIEAKFPPSTTYSWYEVRYQVVQFKEGNVMCGLVEDISLQKIHEEEIEKNKKMSEVAESKQSFLDNLSHEIRTPLNAIVGFSSILCSPESEYLSDEERDEMIRTINENNDILLSLIVDILELSRIESGYSKFKFINVYACDVIQEAFEDERQRIKPQLSYEFRRPAENKMIVTDVMRLKQILHYLIGNANKFTDKGGITVTVDYVRSIDSIVISVIDTGCGIELEQTRIIFERFYKTDIFTQGTGLGLSIVDVIVRRLGGNIKVFSKVGRGSTFVVTLPVHPKL